MITQTKTISNEIPKLTNSAIVNLPQPPKEILFFFPHDLQLNQLSNYFIYPLSHYHWKLVNIITKQISSMHGQNPVAANAVGGF